MHPPRPARRSRAAFLAPSLALALAGAVGTPSCSTSDGGQEVRAAAEDASVGVPAEGGSSSGDGADPGRDRSQEWEEACGDAPPETSCGVTQQELHDLNMRYADRMPFTGDLADAQASAEEVRTVLAPLAERSPTPTEDELRAALEGYEGVQTSPNPVRAAGTGFAVWAGGGCVFGSIAGGEVTVEVAGPIHDGGCLASYGH